MNNHDNPMAQGQLERLKHEIDRIIPYLQMEGEWNVHELPEQANVHTVYMLKREGAVTKVGRDIAEPGGDLLNTWRWNKRAKEALRDYAEQRETLPCSHRIHVTHHPEKDCLTCKECREDGNLPEYERSMVKELL